MLGKFISNNNIKIGRRIDIFKFSRLNSTSTSTQLTGNKQIDNVLDKSKEKVFELMSIYEEAIGLKEIKQAQQRVLEAEERFIKAQNERRSLNTNVSELQSKLRKLRDEMNQLSRTDRKYLELFTQEHEILNSEQDIMKQYKEKENEERDLFFFLSAALRDSQEKERARVERIKYLQLGLSIACTVLGVISAYLINYFRNTHVKEILKYEKIQFKNTQDKLDNLMLFCEGNQTKLEEKINKLYVGFDSPSNLKQSEQEVKPSSTEPAINVDNKKISYDLISVNPYILSLVSVIGFIILSNASK